MDKICMQCGKLFHGAGHICPNCIARENAPQITNETSISYKSDEGIFQRFFSINNRINRMQFLIRTITLAVFNAMIIILFDYIQVNYKNVFENIELFLVLIWIVTLISLFTLMLRRLHDRETSGIWIIISWIIPLGIFALLFIMIFLSGTDGENKYGAKP